MLRFDLFRTQIFQWALHRKRDGVNKLTTVMEIGVRTNEGVPCFVLKPMKFIICFCSNPGLWRIYNRKSNTEMVKIGSFRRFFDADDSLLFLWSINIIDPIKLSHRTIPILRFCRRSVLFTPVFRLRFHVFFNYFSNEGRLLFGGLFSIVGFPPWPYL